MNGIEKAPRWFLLILCGAAIGASWLFGSVLIKSAFAQMDQVKSVAWTAKNLSENNQSSIADLKESVDKIQITQETFRREYREDQKDLDKKLGELLTAIKR